jgi:hypothetical protein
LWGAKGAKILLLACCYQEDALVAPRARRVRAHRLASTGKALGPPLLFKGQKVDSAAFSRDGRQVVIVRYTEAQVWELSTGKTVGPLTVEQWAVANLFRPCTSPG